MSTTLDLLARMSLCVCTAFTGTSAQKGYWCQEMVEVESTKVNKMRISTDTDKVRSKNDSSTAVSAYGNIQKGKRLVREVEDVVMERQSKHK